MKWTFSFPGRCPFFQENSTFSVIKYKINVSGEFVAELLCQSDPTTPYVIECGENGLWETIPCAPTTTNSITSAAEVIQQTSTNSIEVSQTTAAASSELVRLSNKDMYMLIF